MKDIPLGKHTEYKNTYDASLLFPISRREKWDEFEVNASALPFHGADIWNAYEVSWLNSSGIPQVRVAKFIVPVTTPNIIESKSFKLYLNSFNQTQFENEAAVIETLSKDLSAVAGDQIGVTLYPIDHHYDTVDFKSWHCIDDTPAVIPTYEYSSFPAETGNIAPHVTEQLVSHVLKSNCPVTSQPDWASVFISYSGKQISHAALLTYLIGFREHNDFHEQCVERIFMDITEAFQPESLTVYARYTRRGGLDINPYRSTVSSNYHDIPNWKLARQ